MKDALKEIDRFDNPTKPEVTNKNKEAKERAKDDDDEDDDKSNDEVLMDNELDSELYDDQKQVSEDNDTSNNNYP